MKLEYIGHACFRLTTDEGLTWVTDPYNDSIGLDRPAVKADVATLSHGHYDHNCVDALDGADNVFKAAGVYNINGVKFELIKCWHDDVQGAKRGENLITVCEADGLRICHMGDIGHQPDAALLNAVGHVDVMLIPVGGTYTLDADGAAQAVRAFAPKAVIPMHFKVGRLSLPIAAPDAFLAKSGAYTKAGSCIEIDASTAGTILMTPARA